MKKMEKSIYFIEQRGLSASIFGKRTATATDTMTHQDSCYPSEHKLPGVSYLVNRIIKYLMSTVREENEIHTCLYI